MQHSEGRGRAEEEWRGRLRTPHNNDATGEEFQKHKAVQAEMFEVFGAGEKSECTGGLAQDEMTHMEAGGAARRGAEQQLHRRPDVEQAGRMSRAAGPSEQDEEVILEKRNKRNVPRYSFRSETSER